MPDDYLNSCVKYYSNPDNSNSAEFYVTGDSKFLDGILDDEQVLGPTTESGWNIYHKADTASKANTDPITGMRTKLDINIDQFHSTQPPCVQFHYLFFMVFHDQLKNNTT